MIKISTGDTSRVTGRSVEVELDTVLRLARLASRAGIRLDAWADAHERRKAGRSGFRRSIGGGSSPWDLSGRCEAPVPVALTGRRSYDFARDRVADPPFTVYIMVRCRHCGWCRMKRSSEWADKALAEYRAAPRTWMGTLTLEPGQHALALTAARGGLIRKDKHGKCMYRENGTPMYSIVPCPEYDSLPADERFARLVRVIGADLTLFIKRVRKNSAAPFKYLMVAEQHKSGNPHFHMLIHEQSVSAPVRKSVLKDAWSLGFTKFSLVDSPGGAVYVCKYMAKEALSRMRASFKYGSPPIPLHCDAPEPKVQGGMIPKRNPSYCGTEGNKGQGAVTPAHEPSSSVNGAQHEQDVRTLTDVRI